MNITVTYGKGFEPVRTARERVDALEQSMLSVPQSTVGIREFFAPGLYFREMTVKKGDVVVGAVHRAESIVVLSVGRLRLVTDDGTIEISAPHIRTCKPGTKNAAYALEDSVWTNQFDTIETDPEKLAALLTESTLAEMVGGGENKQALHQIELQRKESPWLGQS